MSDIIANAKQLLDGATPGPWSFQPWSKYTGPNGDYEESTLFDSDGETLCHGLPDSEGELIAAAPELAQALAEETWEYQVQTRSQRMPTWSAITDDTLQKWYPEDKYNDLIHTGRIVRGGAGFEIRVLRRRVSPPEVINE